MRPGRARGPTSKLVTDCNFLKAPPGLCSWFDDKRFGVIKEHHMGNYSCDSGQLNYFGSHDRDFM